MSLPTIVKLYDVNSTFVQDSTTIYFGAEASDRAGYSMAPGVNLFANGVPGVWVGSIAGPSSAGIVYGITGNPNVSPNLQNVTTSALVQINGQGLNDQIGGNIGVAQIVGDSLPDLLMCASGHASNRGFLAIQTGRSPGTYASTYTIPFSLGSGVTIYGNPGEAFGHDFSVADFSGDGKPNLAVASVLGSGLQGALYISDSSQIIDAPIYTVANMTWSHRISGVTGGTVESIALSETFSGERWAFIGAPGVNSLAGALFAVRASSLVGVDFSLNSHNATHGFRVDGLASSNLLGHRVAVGDIDGSGNEVLGFIGGGDAYIMRTAPVTYSVNLATMADGVNGINITREAGVSGIQNIAFIKSSSPTADDIVVNAFDSTGGLTSNGAVCIFNARDTWPANLVIPSNCSTYIEGGHDGAEIGKFSMVSLGNLRGDGTTALGFSGDTADVGGLSDNGVGYILHPEPTPGASSTTGSITTGPETMNPGSKPSSIFFSGDMDAEIAILGAGAAAVQAGVNTLVDPATQQEVNSGARSGAQQGALRGLTNVIELALTQNNVLDANVAQLVAKALFYVAVFSITFVEQMASHGDALRAFGKSMQVVGTMLATEFMTQAGVKILDGAADELADNGWKSSSSALRTLSHGAARFGLHADSAVQNGPAFALASIVAASATQHVVEETGKSAFNLN